MSIKEEKTLRKTTKNRNRRIKSLKGFVGFQNKSLTK